MTWKDRLQQIVARAPARRRPAPSLEQARDRLRVFIEDVAIPAFEELSEELASLGRETELERGTHHAALRVYHEGDEEFSYGVRGRIYHRMHFAFPEMQGREEGPRFYRAQIDLPGGSHDRDVDRLTKEDLIQDFLDGYRKWMGW